MVAAATVTLWQKPLHCNSTAKATSLCDKSRCDKSGNKCDSQLRPFPSISFQAPPLSSFHKHLLLASHFSSIHCHPTISSLKHNFLPILGTLHSATDSETRLYWAVVELQKRLQLKYWISSGHDSVIGIGLMENIWTLPPLLWSSSPFESQEIFWI